MSERGPLFVNIYICWKSRKRSLLLFAQNVDGMPDTVVEYNQMIACLTEHLQYLEQQSAGHNGNNDSL